MTRDAAKKPPPPVRVAVFPAAGVGTRFLPATKAVPKEMLPIVDKPVIQYVIEEAVASGIESIIIVTGRGKTAIEDHFDIAYELEQLLERRGKLELLEQVRSISNMINVSYVRQKEPLGLGHAILMARDLVGREPFAVFLGDDVIEARVPVMRQMVDVYQRYRSPLVAVEKPPPEEAPSNLAIIGRYILTPEIFDHLSRTTPGSGGEIQLTDALRSLRKKQSLYAYQFEGKRYDTGGKLGFLKATVEFALRRPDLGGAFRTYLRRLNLDDSSARPASPGRRARRRGTPRRRGRSSRTRRR